MQTVTELIKTLSVLSVVLAAVWMLIPKGAMEKPFRYVLGMFVAAAIVTAVMTAFDRGFWVESTPAQAENSTQVTAQSLSATTAEYIIAGLLDGAGIKYREIHAVTDISDDSGISIIKATVALYDREDAERAAELVFAQTGIILTEES